MSTYKFEVRIGDKTIACRAFTLREYKDLLQAKLEKRLEPFIVSLLNDCTDAKGLNKQESELLLINLWAHSIGQVNAEHIWNCDCGNEISVPINLTHAYIDSTGDLLYAFKGFKIKFRYPDLFEDKNPASMVAQCIEHLITDDGQLLSVDDLSEREVNDLYSAITSEDIIRIQEMLLEPTVKMGIPISCSCGKSHVHVISGLTEFFRML